MKRTVRSFLLSALIVLPLVFAIAGCGDVSELEKLSPPAVILTDNVASWDRNEDVTEWEISVNGASSYLEKSITSMSLTDGDEFKVRALGDGVYFSHSEWSNAVEYTKPETKKYTVTWKNYDGTVLCTDHVTEGEAPEYGQSEPLKPMDELYIYTHTGWTPAVSAATADVTYTAVFAQAQRLYNINWISDGTVIRTDKLAYGSVPTHVGEVPQKTEDARYTYTFDGWTPNITAVVSDATYTASFRAVPRRYTVTWKNIDGSILGSDELEYGELPVYAGAAPEYPANGGIYLFDGWTPSLEAVVADGEYTARYVKQYTLEFIDHNGSLICSEAVSEGSSVSAPATPARIGYTFAGWNTKVDGSGTSYAEGAILDDSIFSNSEGCSAVLYACWTPQAYTVTYDPNGGAGVTASSFHVYDSASNLTASGFIRDGYEFWGWSTIPDAKLPTYSNCASVKNVSDSDVTLYAVWHAVSASLNYSDAVTLDQGDSYSEHPTPGFDLVLLGSLGYERINVSLTFLAQRTAAAGNSRANLYVSTSAETYRLLENYCFQKGDWERMSFSVTVSIDDLAAGGALILEWTDNSAGDNGWILGARTVTFTAEK